MEVKTKLMVIQVIQGLLRRVDVPKIKEILDTISDARPDLKAEIVNFYPIPQLIQDEEVKKDFFASSFNKESLNYRSPYTNQYFPEGTGYIPSKIIRDLEEKANFLFTEYCELYYNGGLANAFFWEKEDGYLAGAIIIKTESQTENKNKICWHSIHVLDFSVKSSKPNYKINTIIVMDIEADNSGLIGNFSTYITKNKDKTFETPSDSNDTHLSRIGPLVEEVENGLRKDLEDIYLTKTRQIVAKLRFPENQNKRNEFLADFRSGIISNLPTKKFLKN